MPRIFDNIQQTLLSALQGTLKVSERADFCVGYFNLRGWRHIDTLMERWNAGNNEQGGNDGNAGGANGNGVCRLLVGMQDTARDEVRKVLSVRGEELMDQGKVARLKVKAAQDFREQLLVGAPTNADEDGLRRLSRQLRSGRLVVKLFLRYKLHAKLYLLYRSDADIPITGYMGSSNLTFAGLSGQGELNVDVMDYDACQKLERWFHDRWEDKWCLDISQELADIIDESWAREVPIPPYYIYLKMAYHLSEEARAGLLEFRIPRDFRDRLFEYQVAAVKIAAHHLNRRGGVIIGDVVGLGKTLMATALARVMQDDYGTETLVLCPKNLVSMWKNYLREYRLLGDVLSTSLVLNELPNLRRYRVVIIDESHNLRNREGRRYRAIQEYVEKNESKCILLSATPYNKSYLDLSAQLRLFMTEEQSRDVGVRPERLIGELGEVKFNAQYQCPPRSLTAFEKSDYADDWRELMRLFMVRRTRSFIKDYYARTDEETGQKYLLFSDGTRSYFPTRLPRTVAFSLNGVRDDPYAYLYSDPVVSAINDLNLPRYGMANYIAPRPKQRPTPAEQKQLDSLSRAGKRLMGFCRTNLFKRLESGGPAFIQSIERHALRNYVFLHAIEHDLELPLGTQNADLLDPDFSDADEDALLPETGDEVETGDVVVDPGSVGDGADIASLVGGRDKSGPYAPAGAFTESVYRVRAAEVYNLYATRYRSRFKWLRPSLFNANLKKALLEDARSLLAILERCGTWRSERDTKLAALIELLTKQHPQEKVLIFTQFADTVQYLTEQLKGRGLTAIEGVTGESEDPTKLAWRFSPVSNDKRADVRPADELRVLVATDVLSEGQNLQDAAIVVNYDLPWAIIRLVQRAGRVDRIGQHSDIIYCYTFLPAEGVERILRLRERVVRRLRENAEVVGTDESFFDDESSSGVSDAQSFKDLYNEKAGILDDEADSEVDLSSHAYGIWKNATEANPKLKNAIEKLSNVVFSTKAHTGSAIAPQGALVYMRTGDGNDALVYVDRNGESVTQSQLAILRAAECALDTPAIIPRPPEQHDLVLKGVEHILEEETHGSAGQLGSPSGARLRTYERLKQYYQDTRTMLFAPPPELEKVIDTIYRYPLQNSAKDTLNRQLRIGVDNEQLSAIAIDLWASDRLCVIQNETEPQEPQVICSLGLFEA